VVSCFHLEGRKLSLILVKRIISPVATCHSIYLSGALMQCMILLKQGYNSNISSCCGPGNAYFFPIPQVSLPVEFPYFVSY